jgi:hypothetical protein
MATNTNIIRIYANQYISFIPWPVVNQIALNFSLNRCVNKHIFIEDNAYYITTCNDVNMNSLLYNTKSQNQWERGPCPSSGAINT